MRSMKMLQGGVLLAVLIQSLSVVDAGARKMTGTENALIASAGDDNSALR